MKYKTISKFSQVEQTIKKSKFIGSAMPVNSKGEAEKFIGEISEKFRKATHNVFAYRIGVEDKEQFLYSDDREPSGSAGLPTFNAIKGSEVTNCAVVITRFFGGIKLGIGGLVRAYFSTAKAAIEAGEIVEIDIKRSIKISFPYNEVRLVMYFVHQFDGKIINEEYGEKITLTVSLKEDYIEQFIKSIKGKSKNVIFL